MALSLPVVDNLLSFSKLKSLITGQTSIPKGGNKPWRPPQWSNSDTVYIRTCVSEYVENEPANYEPPPGDGGWKYTDTSTDTGRKVNTPAPSSNWKSYFFDAVFKTDHESDLRITEHPVQTGANISDHAYLLPARLIMEIGMSDAMDAYTAGQFMDDSSKSVSAYKVLCRLQEKRAPLTVVTRLKKYENMIIESISAPDTLQTYYGLRVTVTFKQIIMATSSASKSSNGSVVEGSDSLRPQTAVAETAKAAVQPKTILKDIPAESDLLNTADNVLGEISGAAGSVVSTATSAVQTVTGFVSSVPAAVKSYMGQLYPYGLPSDLSTMTYDYIKTRGYLP